MYDFYHMTTPLLFFFFFFFNDTATTEIYTLSLHDALPILFCAAILAGIIFSLGASSTSRKFPAMRLWPDRKSTRLNSSHSQISYAVFCLKKKNIKRSSLHLSVSFTSRDSRQLRCSPCVRAT